jgi:phage terminase large subunit-like protein
MRLGPGDYYGRPFRLTGFERRWVWRLFEYYPESVTDELPLGRFRYKRALFGTGKGNGKTPFEGAVGAEGLCGPTAPVAPLVLVAASALVQSNLVFGDLKAGVTHDDSPLKQYVEAYDLSVQLRDGPGEIKRVAAAAGSNDGPRATRLLADELHEWTGALAGVFDILDGAIGKRLNAFTVGISTAGTDLHSLLGRMYTRGKQLHSGELVDDEMLFEWYEIPESVEIPERIRTEADLAQWRSAIAWANPALADGKFLHESYIRSRFDGAQAIERHKWLRYHGNRWTKAETAWLPPGKWSDCRRERQPAEREEIVLAFSGTYDGDAAGLVAVALSDGFMWRVGSWESESDGYEVPRDVVAEVVRGTMAQYRVKRLVVNPNGWHGEAQDWAGAYGTRVVVLFDWMHQLKRRHDACSKFFTSVLTHDIGHDGDPALARHLESATEKETAEGAWITQSSRTGPPIVLAVAAVLSWDAYGALSGPRGKSATLVTF